jgi:PadR family transcriptional regulator, regulatory protein AphA
MATAVRTTLSTTELSILGLLFAGERSGYDLKKAAAEGVGYVWTPAKSHVYAVLPRLVDGGYATARTVVQERRPDKRVYRITAQGKETFVRWLEEPIDERPGSKDLFLLKVFFGGRMGREALVAHVERRRAYAVEKLAEFREIEDELRGDEAALGGYATLRWGLAEAEAWIRWADEILAEL